MRSVFSFLLLATIRLISRLLYRLRDEWVSGRTPDRFQGLRIIAILNHTSLYEVLMAGYAPLGLVWQIAHHGVLPVAEKTMKRWVGLLFRFLVRHSLVVTRHRDHTWDRVLGHVNSKSLVIILPEGRMKRRNGLDSMGRPMTVRGGIADILEAVPEGRMLLLYSGGLHHIQAPGELLPRLFKTIYVCFEVVDIPTYRAELMAKGGPEQFKGAVIADLERRRDTYCPVQESLAVGGDQEALGSERRAVSGER